MTGWALLFTALGILFLLKQLKWDSQVPFFNGFLGQIKVQPHPVVAILGITFLLVGINMSGWFDVSALISDFFTGAQVPSTTIPATTTATAGTLSGLCSPSITPQRLGESATIDVFTYDKESDSQASVIVPVAVFKGDGKKIKDVNSYNAGGGSVITAAIGDVLKVQGGNETWLVDEVDTFCVDSARPTLELSAHKIQDVTNMQVTCYDDTATTVLSTTNQNNTQEDYELAMGASETTTFYCKLKNNAANGAFDLAGVAMVEYNSTTIDYVNLLEPGWRTDAVPGFLKSTIYLQEHTTANGPINTTASKYDKLYIRDPDGDGVPDAFRLSEWDSIKYKYEIKTLSTDPVADDIGSQDSASLVALMYLDAASAEGKDGKMYYDIHDHTDSEGNVGLDEKIHSPLGLELGAIIELQ